MKKTLTLLGMAAAFLAAASCSKSEMDTKEPEAPSAESVKVAISVSGFSPDTKAVKTGWETGDIINVYLDDASSYEPDFSLTYDGSSWNASALDAAVVARLKTSGGTLFGFWEDSNSCMSSSSSWQKYGSKWMQFPGGSGHLVADFSSIPYTWSEGTLTASVDSWRFRTNFQLVVSGLTYEPGRYTLHSKTIASPHSIAIDGECYVTMSRSGFPEGRIAGIENTDGVAFVGAISDYAIRRHVFTLRDNDTGLTYTFKKEGLKFTPSGGTKIVAVKIPFSKFSNVAAVDLGLSVKWAGCNLGAGTESDYGDYYAWGETEPYYISQSPTKWQSGKGGGYDWSSYKYGDGITFTRYTGEDFDKLQFDLYGYDDAASAILGQGWRMPTFDEWNELLDPENCTWAWKTPADGFAGNGWLVTSKIPGYEANSIFLPAAGMRYEANEVSIAEERGYYWSSNLHMTPVNYAKHMVFDNATPKTWAEKRCRGLSIRAVMEK